METKFLCKYQSKPMFCLLDSGGCEDEWCWCWCCQSRHGGLWRGGSEWINVVQDDPSMFLKRTTGQGQSDSKMRVKSWAILGGVYLQLECHSQYVANLTAKQLCPQGTTARCGSSSSGRGSSVLLNMLSLGLWLWNEDFMQRPQVVSSTDICFVRPFASLQSQCILDFIFFVSRTRQIFKRHQLK